VKTIKVIHRSPNVDLQGKTYHREAVRAIIPDKNLLLMVYSAKRGDYKFPGGGVAAGETREQALVREVMEECGAQLFSIDQEFGKTIEYDRAIAAGYDTFQMTSYYYFCSVCDTLSEQTLDPYEQELGFKPVWISTEDAIRANKTILRNNPGNIPWIVRETFVLEELQKLGM
jgi:8-oxo-dGTP pyrophosphatase MutT (NUDIX family)